MAEALGVRLGGKDAAIEYQSFSQLGKMSTALASHVDTRYWYQWPAALARYLPQKGKRRSSEANGGAWVDLENAGKLLPPRTCLDLSASAFISRHDHYPGAYEGARSQWGGGNENTELAGASLHDFGVTFVILGVALVSQGRFPPS